MKSKNVSIGNESITLYSLDGTFWSSDESEVDLPQRKLAELETLLASLNSKGISNETK